MSRDVELACQGKDVWEQRCFALQEQRAAQWQRQLEEPDVERLTRAEQIKRAEQAVADADHWRTYEIAQRHLDALLRGEGVIDDRQAAELVVPREPIPAPAPTTGPAPGMKRVLRKTVLARDSAGDILQVLEEHLDVPLEAAPLTDPARVLPPLEGVPTSPRELSP